MSPRLPNTPYLNVETDGTKAGTRLTSADGGTGWVVDRLRWRKGEDGWLTVALTVRRPEVTWTGPGGMPDEFDTFTCPISPGCRSSAEVGDKDEWLA